MHANAHALARFRHTPTATVRTPCVSNATAPAAPAAPARPSIDVRRFTPADDPKAAQACLQTSGQALATDPVLGHYLRDPGAVAQGYAQTLSDVSSGQGITLYSAAEGKGTLITYMYPTNKLSRWQELIHGVLFSLFSYIRHPLRLLGLLRLMEQVEDRRAEFYREVGSPFLYIMVAATRPELQGKGVGSALLRRACEDADRQGLHMYLEASSEGSARLYERMGFVHRAVGKVDADAPPAFLMSRPPKALA